MYQSILFPIDIGSIDSYEENFAVAKALSNVSTTKWHLIYVDVYSSGQARATITAWREDYNVNRPHSSLGNITPSEFAMKIVLEKQAA